MNLAMVLGIYASVSKELGLPLKFPGKEETFSKLAQMTDATLLAKASVWAALEEKAALQVFNVTNGDIFRWDSIWGKIANYFEIEKGEIQTIPLATLMPLQKELWATMIKKYHLKMLPFEKLASWPFGDFILGCDYDVISDTTKIKQFGFTEVLDTEKNILAIFDDLKKDKLIPDF